jgi:hypothetical protein
MKVDGAQAVTFKGEKGGGGRDSSVFIGAVARCNGGGNKGGQLGAAPRGRRWGGGGGVTGGWQPIATQCQRERAGGMLGKSH